VDIDAFFASVEQVLDPELQNRPVIVGNGVIASCSYEARTFGLHAGMSIRTAEKLCPEGIFLSGDCSVYMKYSRAAEKICLNCSPSVERVSIDEFLCDMSGCGRLYPNPLLRAQELALEIEDTLGIRVSIGIGENRLIAKTAASFGKPGALTMILTGYGPHFIGPMDISQLHGVGRKRADILRKMNITSIQDIRKLPLSSLRRMFGAWGAYLHTSCRGGEAGLPSYTSLPSSISRETTFHTDTSDRTYITAMLWYLTERAASKLRFLGLESRAVEVRIRYSDFRNARRSSRLSHFSDRDAEIFRIAESLISSLYTRRVTLRSTGLTLSQFRKASQETQLLLFEPEPPPRHLYESVDRIRSRYGHAALAGGRSVHLIGRLDKNNDRGFKLRTPSLTQ